MIKDLATAQEIYQAIQRAARILAITHKQPDGDGLGALSALGQYFKNQGKIYRLFCSDKVPANYRFLPLSHEITNETKVFEENFDLIIVVDAGDLTYAGVADYLPKSFLAKLINIDHHQTNNRFGYLNLVEIGASSASEIIYHLFRLWQVNINKEMATALLNGIIFDTGIFSNAGTTLEALQAAAHLLNLGARHKEINVNFLRNKSLGLLKLWGRAFERLQFNERYNLAFTIITADDFKACQVPLEAGSGLTNFFNELAGADIAMLLVEQPNGGIKGSLRTTKDNIDLAALARLWGGGGHKKAAGFTVFGKLVYNGGRWAII